MDARTNARLEPARRRAATAKHVLAVASGVGLVAALLLGRASHPSRASSSIPATTSGVSQSESDDSFGFDGGSFAPSTAQPQVQSGVS
jgi:hypothetical protein